MPEPTPQSDRIEDRRFPTELLIAIFVHLDGPALVECSAVCRHWYAVVNSYDDLVWAPCAHRDFQTGNKRRFWSLRFPDPHVCNAIGRSLDDRNESQQHHQQRKLRSWQDMYRITRNWFQGNCQGFFPTVKSKAGVCESKMWPQVVVGTPQMHTFFTTLTVTSTGYIIRSNPTYRRPDRPHSIKIQSPWTHQMHYLDQPQTTTRDGEQQQPGSAIHTVFCHYSHPSSNWLVTGSLDGTVALWDVAKQQMVNLWDGHRGRVLCVGMNEDVVVSGGSDCMLRVWDLVEQTQADTARRGMIDISSYLSASSDWIQGVGEIAVASHLVACSPDASGPVLVFSLLTGSLVYELGSPRPMVRDLDWGIVSEDMTGFTKLCLTPYFLLTKGKLPNEQDSIPVLPHRYQPPTPAVPRKQHLSTHTYGYIASLDDTPYTPPPAAQMTPYQLYQYYQSINSTPSSSYLPEATTAEASEVETPKQFRSCINVWDLETGNIVYRLAPILDNPSAGYTITDIRVSPDSSKVFACVEVRTRYQRQERIYCWDFGGKQKARALSDNCTESAELSVVQLDGYLDGSSSNRQAVGNSWACFM
ncbi:WD40-repeat-containing domain protein [Dichotomocladium elegans]|nr:WD40-repeat-containing domain protein [Dichotomocladium elegans]